MANLQKEKSELPNATIVIPTYKRTNLALILAKQIRSFHPDIQIIVVDQSNSLVSNKKSASTSFWGSRQRRETPESALVDSGQARMTASYLDIKKLKIDYHHLPIANSSIAKNTGIKHAKGEIIIFFDDDVEVTKDTISNHLKQYADQNIVGIAGRVINDNEIVPKNTDAETGKTNWLGTKFSYQFWSTKKQTVDFVYGCNMSFRKSALDQIDGFDENFPKIFEEVDLSKRIRKYGSINFEPETLVYHHKAPSGGIRPEEKNNKNKLIFENYGRYLAKNVLFPFSLITLFLRTVSALKISTSTVGTLHQGYFKQILLPFINEFKKGV